MTDGTDARLEAVVGLAPDGRRLAVRSRVAGPTRRVRDVGWLAPDGAEAWPPGDDDDHSPILATDGAVWFLRTPPPGDGPAAPSRVVRRSADGAEATAFSWPLGVRGFRVRGRALWVEVERLPVVALADLAEAVAARRDRATTVRHYTARPVRDWNRWCGPGVAVLLRAIDDTQGALVWEPPPGERLAGWDVSAGGEVVAAVARRRGPDGQDRDRLLWITDTAAEVPLPADTTLDTLRFGPDGRLGLTAHVRPAAGFGEPRAATATPAGLALGPARARWPSVVGWVGGALLTIGAVDGESVLMIDGDTVATGITQAAAAGDGWVGVRSGIGSPPRAVAAGGLPGRSRACEVSSVHVQHGARRTQAWVAAPARPDGRVLLWIHGGPLSQWADTAHPRWDPVPYITRGFTVVLPNPAGSTGVSADHTDAVGGNRWGAALEDVLAVLDHVVAERGLDATRVAVMGASFGGWAASWLAGSTRRFRCAVVHAGLARMSAMHGVSDVPGFLERHLGGAPDDGSDFDRWSPIRLAPRWRTPTLITHGEKDFRVPVGEAIALFQALSRRGVPAELRVYPDAHHWIERPVDVADWHAAVQDLLDRNMA